MRARRGTEAWSGTSWDDALDVMAGRMDAVGRERVGFWQGHGNLANDYGFGLKRAQMERFANLYGCQFWNPAMICWGLGGFGAGLTGAIETSTKEDLGENSEFVILWGANTVSQAATLAMSRSRSGVAPGSSSWTCAEPKPRRWRMRWFSSGRARTRRWRWP